MTRRDIVNSSQLSHGIKSEILNIARVIFSFLGSPHYFSEINISALALLKMVMHAKSGGRLEIMGLLLGMFTPPIITGKTHSGHIILSYEECHSCNLH